MLLLAPQNTGWRDNITYSTSCRNHLLWETHGNPENGCENHSKSMFSLFKHHFWRLKTSIVQPPAADLRIPADTNSPWATGALRFLGATGAVAQSPSRAKGGTKYQVLVGRCREQGSFSKPRDSRLQWRFTSFFRIPIDLFWCFFVMNIIYLILRTTPCQLWGFTSAWGAQRK